MRVGQPLRRVLRDGHHSRVPGREKGTSYNPARGEVVIERAAQELDAVVPLDGASHAEVTGYEIVAAGGGYALRASTKAGTATLADAGQFVGFVGAGSGEPSAVLLRHNGLHVEIQIDRSHNVGAAHPAGVKDVVLESAITTIQDCEDSVAAVDAEDKTLVYRNWLGLMTGALEETFEKGGETVHRTLVVTGRIPPRTGAN